MSNIILANRSVGRQGLAKNKDGTRIELAACAAQFFAQQGYHGTSTQTIAQHCQIRKASLFHHYKTKEDIALAAIKYVHNECDQYIFIHAENMEVDSEQRISNFLQACEEFFSQRVEGLLPTLLGLELGETKVFSQAIESYFDAWVDSVTSLLQPLHGNADQARQLAQQSVTRIQGHLVVARIQQSLQFADLSAELRQLWLKPA
ncbi:MAG: TetR/AcrR family transcriptional regulator [Gammaproteobacteria bacterium]